MSPSPVWAPFEPRLSNSETSSLYVLSKSKLGEGSYSTVFECKSTVTGLHYATKMYSKKLVYGLESAIQNEFEILKKISMNHPNILTLVDHFNSKDLIYLVTDLAAGGELFERITSPPNYKLTEGQARDITKTLVNTVEYLHSNHIVHRDLKAENLLFHSKSSFEILVADFGLAKVLEPGQKLHDVTGTLSYMAPEMFDRKKGHDFSVDIWAIGVIAYFMLCGYMPFDCETDSETREAIANADYPYEPAEYWDHISPDAKLFIDSCLQINNRPGARELMAHSWIATDCQAQKSSFNNLVKLRESVMLLHQKQGSETISLPNAYLLGILPVGSYNNLSMFKLTQLEKGRKNSLAEGATLQGAMCRSPEQVSRFNTPTGSAAVSRQHSLEKIAAGRRAVGMVASRSEEPPKFFL
ncbi:Ca2+/calmodulin-dependent protein kinase [Suhomyces tanzawaensis NRRL Y-17324]|uniref:Ca2+/calmodulin-dependent protein kinase n=1 Tax=Suhomyces tanzawaensis NRRL Y-17324 TaxID=984487 RepID=A0A1E4SGC3_9ASCO|nr:Ca2+/calmodulin-dependent protein kinase [Suhomyces tanzawaensis NRRL Y-17324]ODV78561.1 Ca2+/calmodulin-dependent protein kinase [Suhomyces tanzawaensis NRRL Y-17324]